MGADGVTPALTLYRLGETSPAVRLDASHFEAALALQADERAAPTDHAIDTPSP